MLAKNLSQHLEANLRQHIKMLSHHPGLSEIFEYTTLPAGKLFRPKLSMALALDLTKDIHPDQYLWCSFLEIHHVYSLIHDDMPCMDNDDFRRGRPSAHKKFNEWKALLAGDAMINMSYALIGKMQSPHSHKILKLASWALGPKGLILGQYMDLNLESQKGLTELLMMHKYKTARLIQIALVGTAIIYGQDSLTTIKDLMRLGEAIGINFQLADDLDDLKDASAHEKKINPFLIYGHENMLSIIDKNQQTIVNILEKNQWPHLKDYINHWQLK